MNMSGPFCGRRGVEEMDWVAALSEGRADETMVRFVSDTRRRLTRAYAERRFDEAVFIVHMAALDALAATFTARVNSCNHLVESAAVTLIHAANAIAAVPPRVAAVADPAARA